MEERTKLDRTFKPHWVWAIALGSSIGWGCFVLPAEWIGTAGPLGAIIGLLIGALLMMVISVSYGYMIEKYPVSGGEFAYAYKGFGRNHAFICGWFLTLGYISIVALNASAFSLLFKFTVPSIVKVGYLYEVSGWDVYLGEIVIASLSLLVFAYFNIRGSQMSGRLQFIFCVILVAGVVLLAVSMALNPATEFSNLNPLFKPGIPAISGILAIVAIAPWAFVGFDNIPQAAEEFNFSPKKAFGLIIWSLIFAGSLYALMIVVTSLSIPWQQLLAGKPVWGTGEVVSGSLGIIGMIMLAISLCMGVFTGLNGFIVSSSRLMFAMARAKILPSIFAKVHPKYGTPYVGVLFTTFVCLFAPWFGRQALLWVVDMASIGVTIAYFYTCFAAFRLMKKDPEATTVKRGVSMAGAVLGVAFAALLLVPGSPAQLSMPSLIALAVWVGLGGIFYLINQKEFSSIPKAELDYYILGHKPKEKKTSKKRVWLPRETSV
ncbi:MAG TPA: APC family permease [Bacillaceae bacterium]